MIEQNGYSVVIIKPSIVFVPKTWLVPGCVVLTLLAVVKFADVDGDSTIGHWLTVSLGVRSAVVNGTGEVECVSCVVLGV